VIFKKYNKYKINMTIIFNTKYGKINLYQNDYLYIKEFKNGNYWKEELLLKLKKYINPNKNVIVIGAHCGTSSIVYASYLNKGSYVYAFEPQKHLYKLLLKNITDNNLQDKIIPVNKGFFTYTGKGFMDSICCDDIYECNIIKRYEKETFLPCNFGGVTVGLSGENVEFTTLDEFDIDNVGFISVVAQGSENFIFSKATNMISKYRPVVYYQNCAEYNQKLHLNVLFYYTQFIDESMFNIKDYCANILNYSIINNGTFLQQIYDIIPTSQPMNSNIQSNVWIIAGSGSPNNRIQYSLDSIDWIPINNTRLSIFKTIQYFSSFNNPMPSLL
jgi:FkbM family methyltransferase